MTTEISENKSQNYTDTSHISGIIIAGFIDVNNAGIDINSENNNPVNELKKILNYWRLVAELVKNKKIGIMKIPDAVVVFYEGNDHPNTTYSYYNDLAFYGPSLQRLGTIEGLNASLVEKYNAFNSLNKFKEEYQGILLELFNFVLRDELPQECRVNYTKARKYILINFEDDKLAQLLYELNDAVTDSQWSLLEELLTKHITDLEALNNS